MAKTKFTDWSTTADSNTDIGGIGILGTNQRANFDNAVRELMAQFARVNAGIDPIFATWTFGDPGDPTKRFRFNVAGILAGQTRIITVPDESGSLFINGGVLVLQVSAVPNPTTNGQLVWDSENFRIVAGDGSGQRYFSSGPSTTVDNTLPRFDGTKGRLQPSAVSADDSGNLATTGSATAANGFFVGSVRVGGAPDAVLEEQQAQGTDAGTFTQDAWQVRALNTEVRDPGGLMSVSAGQFTPTASGWVEWSAPAHQVNSHKTRLYNVTDGAVVCFGTPEIAPSSVSVSSRSVGGGAVVAGKTYRIEHYCGTTKATDGFGQHVGSLGTEVYTRLSFWRA